MRAAAAFIAGLMALPALATDFRCIGERAAVLYDAPSLKADRVYVVSRGHPFEVLVKLDQWTKVRDAGGEVAWVENRMLGERRNVLVSVPLADVRATADAKSPLVFEAYRQVLLEVLEPAADGWVKVRHRDGQAGYARLAHLWGL
jgi:SH3-like domain-containing protein